MIEITFFHKLLLSSISIVFVPSTCTHISFDSSSTLLTNQLHFHCSFAFIQLNLIASLSLLKLLLLHDIDNILKLANCHSKVWINDVGHVKR